jgi:hypothetical protein
VNRDQLLFNYEHRTRWEDDQNSKLRKGLGGSVSGVFQGLLRKADASHELPVKTADNATKIRAEYVAIIRPVLQWIPSAISKATDCTARVRFLPGRSVRNCVPSPHPNPPSELPPPRGYMRPKLEVSSPYSCDFKSAWNFACIPVI